MGASGLGSLLVKEGFLTEQDRLTITKTCGQGSWAFAKSIVAMGLLDEDELAAFFAERTRYQIAPKDFLKHLDQDAVLSFDRRLVTKLEVIPLKRDSGKITLGVVDPLDYATLKQVEFFTGLEVKPVVVPLSQLYKGLVTIDPEFRLQPTALTHFLQNHAQSAWVRQKIDSSEVKAPRKATHPDQALINSGEDLFEEVTEIEELDDDAIEMEDLDAQPAEDSDDDLVDNTFESFQSAAASDDEDNPVEDGDPFGGTRELAFNADQALSEEDASEDLVAEANPFETLSEEDEDSGFEDSLLDRLNNKDEAQAKPTSKAPGEDFEEADDVVENKAETQSDSDDFTVPEDSEIAIDDGVREEEETAAHDHSEMETLDGDYEMPEVSTFGFEETKPRGLPQQKLSSDFGVPERSFGSPGEIGLSDIDPEPLRDDPLDSLSDDQQPTLDISSLRDATDPLDKDLLADLAADDTETPLSRVDGPSFMMDEETRKPSRLKPPETPRAFDGDDETNINLHVAARKEDDDDIQLHPKTPSEHKDSGLNPTSLLNEMILKLSLCFSHDAAQEILEAYLPRLGRAGCLLNLADQRQFLWKNGLIMREQLGPAAMNPMQGGLEEKKWKSSALRASESWTGQAMQLRIYRYESWLWAHSLSEGNDSAIFRETVESAVNQASLKLAAGR